MDSYAAIESLPARGGKYGSSPCCCCVQLVSTCVIYTFNKAPDKTGLANWVSFIESENVSLNKLCLPQHVIFHTTGRYTVHPSLYQTAQGRLSRNIISPIFKIFGCEGLNKIMGRGT